MEESDAGPSEGARSAPSDGPRPKKFRSLLSTEAAEWDTEERGCILPIAGIFCVVFVIYLLLSICWGILR